MNAIINLLPAFIAGILLGFFYFYSLWLTVRQLPTTQIPIRLFIGSYLGRLVITLLGVYLVIDGHWERGLIWLVGFVLARIILTRIWGPKQSNLQLSRKE